ncbi:MAG: T9SS C-terminal target domain-containing protein, partial [Ignavibacteriae bacterium]
DHRGVDLEEADGAKDIGYPYEAMTTGSELENGSPLDCWFNGNVAVLYKNRFDQNSFPKSSSFSGAASMVTIKDFSARSPRMTMSVEIGNQLLQRDSLVSRSLLNTAVNSFPISTKNHLYLPTSRGIYALGNNGQSLAGNSTGLLSFAASGVGAAVNVLPDSTEVVASIQDSVLRIFKLAFHNGQTSVDSTRKIYAHRFTTSPSFAQLNMPSILIGAESGSLSVLNFNGDTVSTRVVGTDPVASISVLPTPSLSKPDEYFFTSGNKLFGENSTVDLPVSAQGWMLAGAVSPRGNFIIAAQKNGTEILSFHRTLSQRNFDITVPGLGIREIAVADIDGDGEKDVILQSANSISVLNRNGSMLDGFPFQARAGLEYTGTPLVLDFNGDGRQEIVLLTNDGELWIIDRSGRLLAGFPMQVTTAGRTYPLAYLSPPSSNKIGLAFLSESGSFDAFLSSTNAAPASLTWWQHLGNEGNGNTDASISPAVPISTEYFPKSRVYNWPNPVYGQSTQIRYYTGEDANVLVTILDLSGRKITELSGKGTAGMDNEITWNVSNIQSGIYLARVEARSAAKSEVVFVKIAVVK